MNKIMFLSKNWYFSVQKALIYYTVNKSRLNSFILLVFSHVANFRYVMNFRFLTLFASVCEDGKNLYQFWHLGSLQVLCSHRKSQMSKTFNIINRIIMLF